jgi:hypothetical protein
MQKKDKMKEVLNRRGFIRSIGRTGIFSVLIGGSAFLLTRKREGHEACNFDFVCGNCQKIHFCKLPEASVFRMEKRKMRKDERQG